MDGKLKPTMGSKGANKMLHIVEGDKFILVIDPSTVAARNATDHTQFMSFGEEADAKIIDYTGRDNKIVEVYSIERTPKLITVVTQNYKGWVPFTIIAECCYYDEETFYRRAKAHYDFVKELDRAEEFYNTVVDEYARFVEATGLYIQDMNANNILMNETLDDFRLVDIASTQKHVEPVSVDPVGILLTGKFRWIHYPGNMAAVDPVIFKYIPEHEELMRMVETIQPRTI